MKPYDLARQFLQPFKERGEELIAQKCPFCHGGGHNDKYTFAMNIQSGTFNCMRGSCAARGSFTDLCEHFGVEPEKCHTPATAAPRKQKAYKKPEKPIEARATAAEEYLMLRKISKSTQDAYGVGSDESGNIAFPYRLEGEVLFVKYRPARKVAKGERKMWCEKDGKPILYGMDLCDPALPLVITEGEIDALSVYESGVKNAVSVPNGSQAMDWIDLCWDWLEKFETITLCGDMDEPGQTMVRMLANRLGAWRCRVVTLPCKDANETLYFHGAEKLREAVEAAKIVPIHGLIDLADVKPYDVTNVPRVASGIESIDRQTGGFAMGELSVWTGKRGCGKSTFLGQMLLEAIDQDERVCAYSGELNASSFQYWIDLQAAGPKNVASYFDQLAQRDVYYVPSTVRERIHDWYRGRFFLYDNDVAGEGEETSVLAVFELAARRYGCKVFLVDNLMTSRFDVKSERDYYRAQAAFVGRLAAFAKKFSAHVHLVAHPRKGAGDIENDDVSGTSETTDRADNVFVLARVTDAAKGIDKIVLRIKKNRAHGAQDKRVTELAYCQKSRRIYAPSANNERKYAWEVPEWLRNATIWEPTYLELEGGASDV